MTRSWFTTNTILPEHAQTEVRQVYIWITTVDGHVVLVSKDNESWQQPGGHPDPDETMQQTAMRESSEETGITLQSEQLQLFGYYHISDESGEYLQLRLKAAVQTPADELQLQAAQQDDIKFVKAVPLQHVSDYLPWVEESGELAGFVSKE